MAVPSDGSYGVPAGLVFSFPVTISPGGEWKIVRGLHWDDFAKEKIAITRKVRWNDVVAVATVGLMEWIEDLLKESCEEQPHALLSERPKCRII